MMLATTVFRLVLIDLESSMLHSKAPHISHVASLLKRLPVGGSNALTLISSFTINISDYLSALLGIMVP